MIITKYPEWVEAQLKIIDERIEAIYREYADVKLPPDEAMHDDFLWLADAYRK